MHREPIETPTTTSSLAALADAYWDGRLAAEPGDATLLGFGRYDDRLADPSEAGREREIARLEALLRRVQALDAAALPPADRITLRLLTGEIESDLARWACDLDAWSVDARRGPQLEFLTLGRLQASATAEQGRALVARWRAMAPFIDERVARLQQARQGGRAAPRGAVQRVLDQLDDLLAQPVEAWALMAPRDAPRTAWPEAERKAFVEAVEEAVVDRIRPAFQRYREALARDILPHARGDERVGLSHLPGGDACYARLIKVHTSLELTADEVHRVGLDEVARVRDEMKALGEKALGTSDLPEIQRRLREDPALFFATREEIEAKAALALERASAAFPAWFGRLPRTPCVVKRIEPYEEKDSTLGYYLQPAADGSRPGTYYINTYAPRTRPRYEAEVLAFHEAVPGHHSQCAIAQELGELPEFRKHAGVTAYVEGWALYTERLADEMGLYSGDLDRIGMLSFDAWRATRLVVDTGLHVKGWSRAQAEAYMLENTILSAENIANEVDRYINWPGQALAYKLGQLEIQRLRREAERALGPRFDVKGFHDTVLGAGAVSLPVLRELVDGWVAAQPR